MLEEAPLLTRVLLEVIRGIDEKRPKMFITDTFFPMSENVRGEYIDIDVVDGNRILAPFVSEIDPGTLVETPAYQTKTIKPPYLKPLTAVDVTDFSKRIAGNNAYSSADINVMAELIGEKVAMMLDSILRRIESMNAECMRTGTVTIVGETVNQVIDYGRDPNLTIILGGTDVWENVTSNPLKDIKEWTRMIRQRSGLVPTDIILGANAYDAFRDHPSVQKVFDVRRMDVGELRRAASEEINGAVFYGRAEGVDIWEYDEWHNIAGVDTPVIDPKKVLMVSRRAANRTVFGAVKHVRAGLVSTRFFPNDWIDDRQNARFVEIHSRPVPILRHPNSTLCAKVIA